MFVKWLMDVNETTLFGDKTVRELTKKSPVRLSDGSFGTVRDILTGDVGFTIEYAITLKDGSVLNLNTESKMFVRCSTTNNTPRVLNIRSIHLLFRHYFDNQVKDTELIFTIVVSIKDQLVTVNQTNTEKSTLPLDLKGNVAGRNSFRDSI